MRDTRRELHLSRLCFMMDDANLGDRREVIVNLLHCARRAYHEGQLYTAEQQSKDALKQLRKRRHSLRVAGADPENIALIDLAINVLITVLEKKTPLTEASKWHLSLRGELIIVTFLLLTFALLVELELLRY